jgi:hypothetical protein
MEGFFAAAVMSHHLLTDAAYLTALSSTKVPISSFWVHVRVAIAS